MSRDINPFGLRMPPELREKIQEAAEKSGRSMNAEIVHQLERAYDPRFGLIGGDVELSPSAEAQIDRIYELLKAKIMEQSQEAEERSRSAVNARLDGIYGPKQDARKKDLPE